ncbi:hypothetical protein JQ631_01355 [Bradyrhizobium manausense]|jgi:hypothetical protein|uniref:hypothetical protein n=1 Tax=Bradyrhizobium manausense TaxID=989370 RepID=UPI001BA9E6E7|nr:hypothetical protein [Bradyrhizobium manausense]MBR0787694.1 hypothetical protein [Bradyrhizobium manausense]
MKTTRLALAVMLVTGLAAAPFAAQAKSHKKHHSSMSQTTTGANMKKTVPPDASGQGGAGPGSDHGGSMTKPQNGMSK